VLLAKEKGNVVGMLFGFPGRFGEKTYLYSHMTGVVSESKNAGIGKALKLKQKEWALKHGYDLVCWTFDPLMSLNANLNIGKLGGIARSFIPNFYGNMEDSLNRGNYTDRVVCEWWIKTGGINIPAPSKAFDPALHGGNVWDRMDDGDAFILIIPKDYLGMKRNEPEKAVALRITYREVFRSIFKSGYVLTGFDRDKSGYIAARRETLPANLGEPVFPVR
jgi:chorismate synthase